MLVELQNQTGTVTMSHFLNWRDFEGVNPEKFFINNHVAGRTRDRLD
jgi:hypothetical protein